MVRLLAVSLQEVEAESKINVWSRTVPSKMFLRKKIIGSVCGGKGSGITLGEVICSWGTKTKRFFDSYVTRRVNERDCNAQSGL